MQNMKNTESNSSSSSNSFDYLEERSDFEKEKNRISNRLPSMSRTIK